MSSPPAPSPDARDRSVLDAVHAVLAEQGMRLSMDAVAQRAGCSKQTLYSRYGNRRNLMRLVMQDYVDGAVAPLRPHVADVRQALLAFAAHHLDELNDPRVVQACRLIDAEAHTLPEEARQIHEDGVETLQRRLAEWLQGAIAAGQLRHDDPHFMAELLLGMLVGLDFERQRFHSPHRAAVEDRRRWATFAVDSFLRAFAPEGRPEFKP